MIKYLAVMLTIIPMLFGLMMPTSPSLALQPPSHTQFGASKSGSGPTDPAELEAFLDTFIGEQMERNHVAGVVVLVVKDGQVFFAKGYGYADVVTRNPADPDTTLFRIASITKLFTWTAVMQLVEEGKLNLDENINTYLDFEIPDTWSQPITLKHLLTHTSGFEERMYDTAASGKELMPLGEWVATHLPARVRPPGEFTAYSNYGVTLAGYIVERVADIPYDEYVEQNILEPLGMTHTTTRQPLPESLTPNMSVGYNFVDGMYQPQEVLWKQYGPAGSAWASANDMARFMIAHLQDGRYEDKRILEESTAQFMHSQAFTHETRLNGMAYGFIEASQNGQWVIGHGGDIPPFYSDLEILPEQGIGIFVSLNTDGGFPIQEELVRAFLDHYYPEPEGTAPTPLASSTEQLQRFTGEYHSTRASYTTLEKLRSLFVQACNITSSDGLLVFNYPLGLRTSRSYYQIEPLVFRAVNGDELLFFREDKNGKITHVFQSINPTEAYERPAFYETFAFNIQLLAVINLLFLSVIVTAPIEALIRRVRGRARTQSRSAKLAWWLIFTVFLLSTLVGAGFAWTFFFNFNAFLQGHVPWFGLLQGIAYVVVALTIGAPVLTMMAWKRGDWSIARRIHYTLVTLAAIAQIWFLWNNHVL